MGSGLAASPRPGMTDLDYSFAVLCLSVGQPALQELYLGVRNDLIRRVFEHKNKLLSGFTADYGVDRLVWFEAYDDPATAIAREKTIKKWRRDWKIRLIEQDNPDWRDLSGALGDVARPA